MSAVTEASARPAAADADEPSATGLPASPAGPAEDDARVAMPPAIALPGLVQGMGFGLRPLGFNLNAQRRFGDDWQMRLSHRSDPFFTTSHPDHVKSLFNSKPNTTPAASWP